MPFSLLLGTITITVSIYRSVTCRRVMSMTMPAVPFSSSIRSPMLKGLVALIISPQIMSAMTGCAAKPAIAASTVVPWNSAHPKDRVIGELMTTHWTARYIGNRANLPAHRILDMGVDEALLFRCGQAVRRVKRYRPELYGE